MGSTVPGAEGSGMGTNMHPLQCVSMGGGSIRGEDPGWAAGAQSCSVPFWVPVMGIWGCEWHQPAGLWSSARCLMQRECAWTRWQ